MGIIPKNRMFEQGIENTHPMRSEDPIRFKADTLAMKLVGERHEKRDLVNLVRWLIMDKAKVSNLYLDLKD